MAASGRPGRDGAANSGSIRTSRAFGSTAAVSSRPGRADTAGLIRTPGELFADYCAAQPVPVRDERVAALFARLHDEVTASASGDAPG